MKILIQTKGLEDNQTIKHHGINQTHATLYRFDHLIKHIEIFIADENGPRGGIDKSCLIKVKMETGSELVIRAMAATSYAAMGGALSRTKQSLSRHLKRSKAQQRRRKSDLAEYLAIL